MFSKNTQISNFIKSDQWEPSCFTRTVRRTDGRTDMTKLIVAFRNFVNAHKTYCSKMSKLCYRRMCSSENSDLNHTFSFKYSVCQNGATVLYLPYEFVSFRFSKYCIHLLLPFLSLLHIARSMSETFSTLASDWEKNGSIFMPSFGSVLSKHLQSIRVVTVRRNTHLQHL